MDAEGSLGRLRGHLLRPCVELRMKREKQQVFVKGVSPNDADSRSMLAGV